MTMKNGLKFHIVLILLVVSRFAWANPCYVSTANPTEAGGLVKAIEKARDGACGTTDGSWRSRYSQWGVSAPRYQVIVIEKSTSIPMGDSHSVWMGSSDEPLVIVANEAAVAEIKGASSAIELGSHVILDHVTLRDFSGTALKISGDHAMVINSTITHNGFGSSPAVIVTGLSNQIINSSIDHNASTGLWITEGTSPNCDRVFHEGGGQGTRVIGSRITNNGVAGVGDFYGYGVMINAYDVEIGPLSGETKSIPQSMLVGDRIVDGNQTLYASVVTGNKMGGIWVNSRSVCHSIMNLPLHTAMITHTHVYANGGPTIHHTAEALLPPRDLMTMDAIQDPFVQVVGNVDLTWNDHVLNSQALTVEVYVASADGGRMYVGNTSYIDAASGQFTALLSKEVLQANGADGRSTFAAILIDEEHRNTSAYALTRPMGTNGDWDNDGLADADEDYNRNGKVDIAFGETDPRLWDTDGDGLSDGEERLKTGRVHDKMVTGMVFADIGKLDPTNPDSDGDCLPDGLELGITVDNLTPATQQAYNRMELAPACRLQLNNKGVVKLENAILWNTSAEYSIDNIRTLVDTDPLSTTDPTSRDTDGDGLSDGSEDWNLDGHVTEQDANKIESDPNQRDTDKDGVIDGDEGDQNGNGLLDEDESSPLTADTDSDGVSDNDEKKQSLKSNQCDSDGDGLSDAVENGLIVKATEGGCSGLSPSGTNFKHIDRLNAHMTDSDGDGLQDGDEDKNHNGWLDAGETDPTTADTDDDGIDDYIETTLDFDHDGIADFKLLKVSNPNCSPPSFAIDLDCDGDVNAVDLDSDNDGCLDKDEWTGSTELEEIPAAYTAEKKGCGESNASASASGSAAPLPDEDEGDPAWMNLINPPKAFSSGGGACQLNAGQSPSTTWTWPMAVMLLVVFVSRRRLVKS